MRAHFVDDASPVSATALRAEGILHDRWSTDPSQHREPLERLKLAEGYIHDDVVSLLPDTPNLEAICAKFIDEHRHDEDEVRFVLEGEGVFEIRTRGDRWMRVEVEAGDVLVVPKDRYHRFFLTDRKSIRCVRLFRDASGWTPHYRA